MLGDKDDSNILSKLKIGKWVNGEKYNSNTKRNLSQHCQIQSELKTVSCFHNRRKISVS